MNVINIIGMGQSKKNLTQNHLDIINKCDVIIAGNSHLELFDLPGIKKISIKSSIKNIVDTIKMNNHKIVV
jgi:precorrin-6B methylase 1